MTILLPEADIEGFTYDAVPELLVFGVEFLSYILGNLILLGQTVLSDSKWSDINRILLHVIRHIGLKNEDITFLAGERLLCTDHCLDTIVHVLNQVYLGSSKASSVRDVENAIISLGMLTMDTSDLNVVLVSDSIEHGSILCKEWEPDVNRGSKSSTEVSRAWSDITEMVVVSKFGLLLDEGGSPWQSSEDSQNICSLLHWNNSQLIFLIDPDEESLGIIMENTSSSRPLSIETGSL